VLAAANYAGNWLSMATGGFGNDDWAMEHADEIAGSHGALASAWNTVSTERGRAQIADVAATTYEGVKAGDTGAMARWSAFFGELGTGAVMGSGAVSSTKSFQAASGIVKESAQKLGTTVANATAKVSHY